MKQKNSNDKKPVILKVDKALDQYLTKGIFKGKIEKANQILKTTKLPEFAK